MAKFQIEIDGQDREVQAEIIDKRIWFKLNDQVYSHDLVDLNESHSKNSKSAGKSADRIVAPMPGKVTKIFVNQGQSVQKGDALLVMEAMKMEYTLKADTLAQVEKLSAQVGDQVTLGQLLIQLKIAKSEAP